MSEFIIDWLINENDRYLMLIFHYCILENDEKKFVLNKLSSRNKSYDKKSKCPENVSNWFSFCNHLKSGIKQIFQHNLLNFPQKKKYYHGAMW